MKKLIPVLLCVALLSACSTTGQLTPGQRLFEAQRGYQQAVDQLADYAQLPDHNKAVVEAADNVTRAPETVVALNTLRAWSVCTGKAVGKVGSIDCTQYSFKGSILLTTASILTNAARQMLEALAAKERN